MTLWGKQCRFLSLDSAPAFPPRNEAMRLSCAPTNHSVAHGSLAPLTEWTNHSLKRNVSPSENGWSLTLFFPAMKWIISPLQISGFSSCVFPHTPGHRLRWLKGTTSLWCGINISSNLWKESSFPVISLRLSVFSVLLPEYFFQYFFLSTECDYFRHLCWCHNSRIGLCTRKRANGNHCCL